MFVLQKQFICNIYINIWEIVKQIKTLNYCLRDHPMSRVVNKRDVLNVIKTLHKID